jgi:4-amino-4-deoxy-L-arabinose transferase-like glycosyltransferase
MGGTMTVLAVALGARLGVAAWAHAHFPPAEDGFYYDTVARRIAAGHGYTWLWPDGAVTYAAHYSIGYPALLGAAYALFGAGVGVAMVVNALLGAAGAAAAHRLALHAMPRRHALAAGLVVALHPALVPYAAAVMTEGATTALLLVAASFAARSRADSRAGSSRLGSRAGLWRAAVGLAMGAATLVRPQCLALAPVLGTLSVDEVGWKARLSAAAVVLGLALAVCLPWTVRNCVRMDTCALVSINGGWNLLIGAQTQTGGWAELVVPPACREVWSEGGKDACFGHAAREAIATGLGSWLAKAPAKLAQTFDYIGAAPWYLHASNAAAFDDRAKLAWGATETALTRLLLALALVSSARLPGGRRQARWVVASVGLGFIILLHAWVAYLAMALAVLLRGIDANLKGPLVAPWTAVVVVITGVTHVVFFGAGRYGLVVLPFVAILAASLGTESCELREPTY